MELARVSLEDKYTLQSGRIYLSGIQALVRLPMMQRERDRAAGLEHRGLHFRLSRLAARRLRQRAVAGARRSSSSTTSTSSPASTRTSPRPRCGAASRSACFPAPRSMACSASGTARAPASIARSTCCGTPTRPAPRRTAACWPSPATITAPILHHRPSERAGVRGGDDADPQSGDDAGLSRSRPARLRAVALFRLLGRLQGDRPKRSTARPRSYVDPQRVAISMPQRFRDAAGRPEHPLAARRHGLRRSSRSAACTARRWRRSRAFARANAIDRMVIDPPQPRLGIVATGKAYLDRAAGAGRARHHRTRRRRHSASASTRSALTWPLEPQGALRFADGLKDMLVVEEKRGFVEDQLVRMLYNVDASRRPSIVGKTDETGAPLLPSAGELTPTMVARAVVARLKRLGRRSPQFEQRLARLEAFERPARRRSPKIAAHAVFLLRLSAQHLDASARGQPRDGRHRLPLHGAVHARPRHRDASRIWAAKASPGSARRRSPPSSHVFQNLGDGTYAHSGLLAIRAAAAAGVNITYKILYNDAVAMTGGQPVEGAPDRAADRPPGAGRRRAAASSSSPTSPTNIRRMPVSQPASPSTIATSSTPCSASCARSPASPF